MANSSLCASSLAFIMGQLLNNKCIFYMAGFNKNRKAFWGRVLGSTFLVDFLCINLNEIVTISTLSLSYYAFAFFASATEHKAFCFRAFYSKLCIFAFTEVLSDLAGLSFANKSAGLIE